VFVQRLSYVPALNGHKMPVFLDRVNFFFEDRAAKQNTLIVTGPPAVCQEVVIKDLDGHMHYQLSYAGRTVDFAEHDSLAIFENEDIAAPLITASGDITVFCQSLQRGVNFQHAVHLRGDTFQTLSTDMSWLVVEAEHPSFTKLSWAALDADGNYVTILGNRADGECLMGRLMTTGAEDTFPLTARQITTTPVPLTIYHNLVLWYHYEHGCIMILSIGRQPDHHYREINIVHPIGLRARVMVDDDYLYLLPLEMMQRANVSNGALKYCSYARISLRS